VGRLDYDGRLVELITTYKLAFIKKLMTIRISQPNANLLPSNRSLWFFGAFNLILLCTLSFWLWKQNQPLSMPNAKLADGKMQCVSYSPYYKKGVTPLKLDTYIPAEQIDQDLALLSKQFNCVRIYSVSQGLAHVPEAATKLGMKVYLGAWIGWIKTLNDKELDLAIRLANQYPITIKALIVGNEVLLRGEQSESALKNYILKAKVQTNVPVTYADVWEFWRKHPALENSVDFITVHILPYWEDNPQSIDHALEHTSNVMNLLAQTFEKPILIGETGWPSIGRQRQESEPSLINQASYIRGFLGLAQEKNWQYNLIESMDQPWKRSLEGTVGGYWGIYTNDLKPKFPFTGDVTARQDSLNVAIIACLSALLFTVLAYVLNERRTSAFAAIASLGAVTGLSTMLQSEYLMAASRIGQEWVTLGGLSLLSNLLALSLIWTISKPTANNLTLLKIVLTIFLFSALIGSGLLIVDGRYRDFAVSLYLLAVLELSIGLLLLKCDIRPKHKIYHLFNAVLIGGALYCVYLEPMNVLTYIWLVLNIFIVLAAWPKKSTNHQ
jgi:exo-beta-1,3-glucanase (GH17 family)